MGELLDRAARQQALLDSWHDLRAEARQEGRLDAHFAAFEHQAAQQLATIANQLRQGTWQPSPVHRVAIPKPPGGQRVLDVPVLEAELSSARCCVSSTRSSTPSCCLGSSATGGGWGWPTRCAA